MTRENLQHRGLAAFVAGVALLMAAGLPATAAAQSADVQRARVAVYSGGVDLVPEVAYQRAILTVSGNGQSYRYDLAQGKPLSIGLFDPDGQLLVDGTYRWELQLVPTKQTAEKLRAEAAENNGRALRPWTAQSGSFTVRGGAIADPNLTEEQALNRLADSATARPGLSAGTSLSAVDSDATIGSREGVEAEVNAAAARATPRAALGGVLVQADRAAGDDADATSAALGRSLEATPTTDLISPQSRGAFAPRPRSDGSNGRPRSQ